VGREVCATCHQAETDRWTGSHHDLAMQPANDETVLGDFDGADFTYAGITSTFFRRDDEFLVRTDGPDGELQEYRIAFTFGAIPLQQYLIEFTDGRYQMLGIAWDSRSSEAGGSRWFHVYGEDGEPITHTDPFHWTGTNQTWNRMCADCHSTNLRKNYDLTGDRYETTWSEIDVSCEACHGPASAHVTWAERYERGKSVGPGMGLTVQLSDSASAAWVFDGTAPPASRSVPLSSNSQLDTCAPCHSLRSIHSADPETGQPFLDSYRPRVLDEGLYFADGQIQDEVFVYGSFIQSKMHKAGVQCSDCHDPHSLATYVVGNGLCARCHQPTIYDTSEHHFHPPDSDGAACVECHMPARTYMVVDPRRDHSIRIPRPDLAAQLGTPDACTSCHTDQDPTWAANAVEEWYGPQRPTGVTTGSHYGEVLSAGRQRAPDADVPLAALVEDLEKPAIVRSTAVSLLGRYGSRPAQEAIVRALTDAEPLVRMAAADAVRGLEASRDIPLSIHLLADPVRSVRLQAARTLAGFSREGLTVAQQISLDSAAEEYIQSQLVNADWPSAHLNIGEVQAGRGRLEAAESAYLTAIRVGPEFTPAYANLADLYRSWGRDRESEALLREALAIAPDDAGLHHAHGLLLVRANQPDEAVEELGRAADLDPSNARYPYVYAIALHSYGQSERALEVLEETLVTHPYDRDVLMVLISINAERGATDEAIAYAQRAVRTWPEDQAARSLLTQLEGSR
jgi:Flp pilus assembly protein TadD